MKRPPRAAIAVLISAGFAPATIAATFVVTNTNNDGPGSLRDAIAQSNANGEADTINFDPAVFSSPQTIVLASEIPFLRDGASTGREVTINGPGAELLTIGGNNATRLFSLAQSTDVTLRGATLRDGNGVGDTNTDDGGAIYAGTANLTLADVVVRNNSAANNGGGIFFGGGTASRFSIADCLFTENIAEEGGGIFESSGNSSVKSITNASFLNNTGRATAGGASFSGGTTTITNCRFDGNRAAVDLNGGIGGLNLTLTRGVVSDTTVSNNSAGTMEATGGTGGIQASGDLTFRRITVTGNSVHPRTGTNSDQAGGMRVTGSGAGLTVIDSLIAGNEGSDNGGGIWITGPLVNIINTTIAGNTAVSGGAIRSLATNLNITNSTIAGNLSGLGDAAVYIFGGNAAVQNTIIADNGGGVGNGFDVRGAFVSNGYNIIGDAGGSSGFGAEGDQVNVDPQLDPAGLQNHSGMTLTIALQETSPAINAGSNELAVDENGAPLSTDQRGVPFKRIADGTVDIGAFEGQPPPTVRLTMASPDEILIQGIGVPGQPHTVQAKEHLSQPFETLGMTPAAGPDGSFQFLDTTSLPRRFYRVIFP